MATARPVWDLDSFAAVAPKLPRHFRRVLPSLVGLSIGHRLREQVMLGVAGVNQAPYCKAVHGVVGRLSGIPGSEVERLKSGEAAVADPDAKVAVEYAIDLARRNFIGRDPDLYTELAQSYSAAERDAIEASAHVMNFFNRASNLLVAPLDKLAHS